ncbi:MAG: GDSL-type esterase/lipase family protein [Planctomycetota bacterium]
MSARTRWIAAGLGVLLLVPAMVRWGPGLARRLRPEEATVQRPPQPADMPGTVVTEEVARLILPGLGRNPRLAYDPVAIIVNVPDVVASFPWQEHARGEITFHNDARGFRRMPSDDGAETGPEPGPRILVLGDSHAYGLVDTQETLSAVLEDMLRAREAGPGTVVWNAAVAGSGPFEYVGSLRHHIGLAPDLVVLVFFTGNDFMNALPYDEFRTKQRPPQPDRAMRQRLAGAREHWRAPLAQGFSQALEFTYAPEEAERALASATTALDELATTCVDAGIPLLVALLPTKVDVDLEEGRQSIEKVFEILELDEADYGINAELGARLGRALARPGVRVLDLAPPMRAESRPLYWERDHHLGVLGNRVVARTLLPVVEELLADPP